MLVVNMGSCWPNICDYTELKYNKATPGFVMSVAQCGNKIGIGVASYIITLALSLIGYQETAAVQSASTVSGIHYLMVLLPFIGIVLITWMSRILPQLDRASIVAVDEALSKSRQETLL